MLKKAILFGIFQIISVFLLTKFVEGIEDNKFTFFALFLNQNIVNEIINYKRLILILLIALNFLIYLYTNFYKLEDNKTEIYDKICETVFNATITNNKNLKDSNFRVSLFQVKKSLIFDKKFNKGLFPVYKTYLINVGRHQTRQQKTLSKIKFLPNEGAVGKCYFIGEIHHEFTCKGENIKYTDEQVRKTNLPLNKVKLLNEKSAAFVAIPLRFANSQDISGVIVVDSLDNKFKLDEIRNVEELMIYCSIFFKKT